MPNHIKNRIELSGPAESITALILTYSTKEHEYTQFPDFEKVIPPPGDPAYRDEPSQEVARKSPLWWYTWNIENWGTKWNAYACAKESDTVFTFETAWSSVPEIIDVISIAFPDVTIKYTWADEDTGYNAGRSVFHNGVVELNRAEGGSMEAYEIAFELRPDRKKNYELIDGIYQYKDEE